MELKSSCGLVVSNFTVVCVATPICTRWEYQPLCFRLIKKKKKFHCLFSFSLPNFNSMQQAPGKHLQSHSQLGNSYTISRLLVPLTARASARNMAGARRAGLQKPCEVGTAPARPSLVPAQPCPCKAPMQWQSPEPFLRKKWRRVKYEGILHCGAVCHKVHKIALKTQGKNTNKKYPPLKASNTPSFNLSVFPLQFLIWKEK